MYLYRRLKGNDLVDYWKPDKGWIMDCILYYYKIACLKPKLTRKKCSYCLLSMLGTATYHHSFLKKIIYDNDYFYSPEEDYFHFFYTLFLCCNMTLLLIVINLPGCLLYVSSKKKVSIT